MLENIFTAKQEKPPEESLEEVRADFEEKEYTIIKKVLIFWRKQSRRNLGTRQRTYFSLFLCLLERRLLLLANKIIIRKICLKWVRSRLFKLQKKVE